jgi:hypothetical protein
VQRLGLHVLDEEGRIAPIELAVSTADVIVDEVSTTRQVAIRLYSGHGELRGTLVLTGDCAGDLAMLLLAAAKDTGDQASDAILRVLRMYGDKLAAAIARKRSESN